MILLFCGFLRICEWKPTANFAPLSKMPYSPDTSAGDSAEHLHKVLPVNA